LALVAGVAGSSGLARMLGASTTLVTFSEQ
jgi:hypothetical protein